MAVKNTAKVIIGGKIITLGGYESEEYFQKVASYINKKMDELSAMPGYSRQPMETKHTLISLNITDDYFKAKKQAEVFEQDLQQKDQEMYDLKHELISLRMQIEEAQKHEQEALEQKSLLEGKNKELEKQIAVCQTDIMRLQTEIAGKPLYDVKQAEQVVQESRRMLLQQQKQIAARKADLQQMQAVFVSVRLEGKTLEKTQVACQEYKELYSMLNGTSTDRGGERISFERYVQTYYFTRILEHANQKLYQLSNGRYQLIRRKEEERRTLSSGLNLDVLDQYTGTERDVKTLSGGETFLASLSLALGLSETVQQQSGCVQIQAMFIDEGFGSLDETALENAIRLLQQLSGQDCMVGIISHVPALAERFDAQIRVEKTPNGSRAVCVGMKK